MRKLFSFIIAAGMILSLCASLAPLGAADSLPALGAGAEIAYDAASGYYRGFGPGATVRDVVSSFDGEVAVTTADGAALSASDAIGTDYIVRSGSASARLAVYGDVTGTGRVSARDVYAIMRSMVTGNAINTAAADVYPDGRINSRDVVALMRWIVGWNVVLGERFWGINTNALTAESEDGSLDLFFEDSLAKDSPTSEHFTTDRTFVMRLARNEKESCQVQLYATEKLTGLSASLTDFVSRTGDTLEGQLLFVNYIKILSKDDNSTQVGDLVPDCLPPMERDFSIEAGTRQGLYIEVCADTGAKPGLYRARLDVTNAAGEVIKTAYVYANVWDFALPKSTSTKTMVGLSAYAINSRRTAGDTSDYNELYAKYYEYLLDNRINAWCLPYDPADGRADAWMNDERVNTFMVAGGYGGDLYRNMNGGYVDESAVAAIYAKLSQTPELLEKAAFYCTDEPGIYWAENKWPQAQAVQAQLERVFPGARIVIPEHAAFFQDMPGYDQGYGHVDSFTLCARFSNIMCPCTRLYSDAAYRAANNVDWFHEEVETTYGTMDQRMKAWGEAGKELWWYTANSPRPPMASISQRSTGMMNRMLFWQQYFYDIDGYLYWTTSEWGAKKRSSVGEDAGVLVYPGDDFGIAGPVACQRAGIVRDGLEDVEYLLLAERYLGKSAAQSYVNSLVRNINDFETDSAVLASVREALGDALEAALGQ